LTIKARFLRRILQGEIVMPTYVFHLHDGPGVAPRSETLEARDDEEARGLAELRVTLSSSFTHVEIERDGVEIARLYRDSLGERRG
jgi:hypothetical protein